MPILISKTYEIVTPESAENGEAEERGFEFEDVAYTFKELVDEMRNYIHPSSMPMSGNTREWLSTEAEQDYQDGSYTTYSLHCSHKNTPRQAKYWVKALRASGFLKS